MEWNGNLRNFISRPETSFNFLCNYNYDPFPVMDQMKHQATIAEMQHGLVLPQGIDKVGGCYGNNIQEMKKKRLTSGQLELLEKSFQEEIKLDPDRKMKLARELGLQPRQIAVWFQNRRARWKAKQLEHLYDTLKQEYDALKQGYDALKQGYDVVAREKEKLQEKVVKLRAIIGERGGERKQVSTGCKDVSGEETVESTSVAMCSSGRPNRLDCNHSHIPEANCQLFNIEDYSTQYWVPLPSYP